MKKMNLGIKHNLRLRLVIILLASLFIGALLVGYFLFQQIEHFLHARIDDNLQSYLNLSEHALDHEKVIDKDNNYLKQFADQYSRIIKCRVTFIDTKGLVLADSDVPNDQLPNMENHLNRPEVRNSQNLVMGSDIRLSASVGQNLFYVAKQLQFNNEKIGYLRLAYKIEQFDQLLVSTQNSFFAGGFLVLIISSILISLLSKKITDNLFEIINKANQIAEGDLSTRITIDSKDELGRLGENLNNMAAKLSDSLRKLQRDKTNLNTVLSSVNDGIIAIDHKKRIRFFNQQALAIINVENYIAGKQISDVIFNQHFNSLIDNFYQNPVLVKDDVDIEGRIFDIIITPLKIEGKRREGAVIVLRDITNYKRLEKIRREFVANVSHEFKTPIAAIRGSAETLIDWGDKDENVRSNYLEKIVKQSLQLENLVSDLLQLARIERMQGLEFSEFNPLSILKDVVNEVEDKALKKKLTLKSELPDTQINITGDPEMFRSIVINLLENAIKYTPEGGNIIAEMQVSKRHAVFVIADNGIGIPEEEQDRVFERFYRVDKTRSRSAGGTGLGLSIVKHLAELQNAEVKLESNEGKGSRFSVWYNIV